MQDKFYLVGSLNIDGFTIKLKPSDFARVALYPIKDEELEVTVSKVKKGRTAEQNRYYWGLVVPSIIQHHLQTTGEILTSDEVHYHNVYHIFGVKVEIKVILGHECLIVPKECRTSDMSTVVFSKLIDALKDYYALQGLIILESVKRNFLNER